MKTNFLTASVYPLLVCLALAGCGRKLNPSASSDGASQTAPPVKIRMSLDWYPQPEHGGFYQALVKGYFAESGLDVDLLPANPQDRTTRSVATGKAEFGMTASDEMITAQARHLPLVAVGATMQHDPQAIMVRADSPVKSFADLENRSVSVVTGAIWVKCIMQKFGLKNVKELPMSYAIANFVADPNYIQQCFVTSEPFFVRKKGIEVRTIPLRETGFDNYRVFFGNRDFIAKNPDVTRKFVAACVRGWTTYLVDPTAANAEIAKRNPEMNPEREMFSWQALKDGHYVEGFPDQGEGIGQFKLERWKQLRDIMRQVGVLETDVDPQSAFTTEFLPKAP